MIDPTATRAGSHERIEDSERRTAQFRSAVTRAVAAIVADLAHIASPHHRADLERATQRTLDEAVDAFEQVVLGLTDAQVRALAEPLARRIAYRVLLALEDTPLQG